MDPLAGFLIFCVCFFAFAYISTVLSRRRSNLYTSADPEESLAAFERKFSRFNWKRVDGPGHVNVQYRFVIPIRGAKAPVLSITAEPSEHRPSGSDVTIWMSQWTSMYGAINGAELINFKKWSARRAILRLDTPTASASPTPPEPHGGLAAPPTTPGQHHNSNPQQPNAAQPQKEQPQQHQGSTPPPS